MSESNLLSLNDENSFTSYLDHGSLENDLGLENLQLKMCTGESEVAIAKNVRLFTGLNEKSFLWGSLFVTNFKLSFISNEFEGNIMYQENEFLQRNDVTLQNIDQIYQIDRKRRLLNPHSKINPNLEGLYIVCKNFRVLKFDFKQSEEGQGKCIAQALLKFAFLSRHDLLFAYQHDEKNYNTQLQVTFYNKKVDWECELNRCGATANWKVLSLDHGDAASSALPLHIVIPKPLHDQMYIQFASSFRNGLSAIWVYGLGFASLIRMAELKPKISDVQNQRSIINFIQNCDPDAKPPIILQLNKLLPSIHDIQTSYLKLRDLMTPETTRTFLQQDLRFFSFLNKTNWLLYLSLCLKYANQAATEMRQGTTVILQENDGRDMCCVISSLTQILLDPYFRTRCGFESLIQKDWVALGHPFSDRLGHIINNTTSEQCPLFLLFLDCVWQLLQQFPDEFEFSETFLTTLWDSVFLPIFDTFLFNSEYDRQVARKKRGLVLRPVWDWTDQFSDQDIALFANPLYKKPFDQPNVSKSIETRITKQSGILMPGIQNLNNNRIFKNMQRQNSSLAHNQPMHNQPEHKPFPESRFLTPSWAIHDMEIWMQCYYRWMPVLEIQNGGTPQIDLFNRMILSNISKLQRQLETQQIDDTASTSSQSIDNLIQNMPLISSFFPFTPNTSNTNQLSDILSTSCDLLAEGSIFDGLSMRRFD